MPRLSLAAKHAIARIFKHLDYKTLAGIYCEEGGDQFWKAKRGPCQRLGNIIASALKDRLKLGGRSLYVGAGVAEIPMLVMESLELRRHIDAYNLRRQEVSVLNHACHSMPFSFRSTNAQHARGTFDHLWLVSVLNDPERFPELSALSYGRANPPTFNPTRFSQERKKVLALTHACMKRLSRPGLVTTSVEEIPWIAQWCEQHRTPFVVEDKDYATALVGDPLCFIRIEELKTKKRRALQAVY